MTIYKFVDIEFHCSEEKSFKSIITCNGVMINFHKINKLLKSNLESETWAGIIYKKAEIIEYY